MNNNIGHNITAGIVGALTVVLIGIVIFAIHSPIDVAPVYMINTSYGFNPTASVGQPTL